MDCTRRATERLQEAWRRGPAGLAELIERAAAVDPSVLQSPGGGAAITSTAARAKIIPVAVPHSRSDDRPGSSCYPVTVIVLCDAWIMMSPIGIQRSRSLYICDTQFSLHRNRIGL